MRDALVAGVISAAGRVSSRVKLQKMVYLLQRMGFDLGYVDFSLRDYGPFSADLAATIDVVSESMVKETSENLGPNAQGEPMVQYTYETDPELAPLLQKVLRTRFRQSSRELFRLSKELSQYATRVLEVAATAAYLRDEAHVPDEDLWQQVRTRKPDLTQHFEEAKRLLAEWDQKALLRQ